MSNVAWRTLDISFGEQRVSVPCCEIVGDHDGPRAFVSGGMHGNEINGIVAARRLLDQFSDPAFCSALKGRVTIIPVLNPSVFNTCSGECLRTIGI